MPYGQLLGRNVFHQIPRNGYGIVADEFHQLPRSCYGIVAIVFHQLPSSGYGIVADELIIECFPVGD